MSPKLRSPSSQKRDAATTEVWARYQIEEGGIPILGSDKSEEIRRQTRKLDFQHGMAIREIIVSSLHCRRIRNQLQSVCVVIRPWS